MLRFLTIDFNPPSDGLEGFLEAKTLDEPGIVARALGAPAAAFLGPPAGPGSPPPPGLELATANTKAFPPVLAPLRRPALLAADSCATERHLFKNLLLMLRRRPTPTLNAPPAAAAPFARFFDSADVELRARAPSNALRPSSSSNTDLVTFARIIS